MNQVVTIAKPARRKDRPSEYNIWAGMKQRCYNPKASYYEQYGAKGVTVCEKWMTFDGFIQDMGLRPEGTSLDRVDPNGNYEPSNCRWATNHEQTRNYRDRNVWIEIDGERKIVQDWVKQYGIDRGTFKNRVAKGMSPKDALTMGKLKHGQIKDCK